MVKRFSRASLAVFAVLAGWVVLGAMAVPKWEDEDREEPDETSLKRGIKAKKLHDETCHARFPMLPKVYIEISQPRECWSSRGAGPHRCAMNQPLLDLWDAAHDKQLFNESFADLWSTLLPMFVSGYVDAMGMDARQLDQLVKMRMIAPLKAQSTLDAVARLTWFMRAYEPLASMLGNEELRHAAILYHARHTVVAPSLLARGPPVDDADLQAWKDLYDALQGPLWVKCPQYRDNPCECSFVFCEYQLKNESQLASPNDDERTEISWKRAKWRPNDKMPVWSTGRDRFPWLKDYTLRIVVIALVEEHGAIGAIPVSFKRLTALRALTLTNMAGSITNACEREMSTRILGQMHLRYLSVDWHLSGMGDHAKSGEAPLPLTQWLRSLTVDLSGAASTADPATEWTFTQREDRAVGLKIIDQELRLLNKAKKLAASTGHNQSSADDLAELDMLIAMELEDDEWDVEEDLGASAMSAAMSRTLQAKGMLAAKAIQESEMMMKGKEEDFFEQPKHLQASAELDVEGPIGFGAQDMREELLMSGESGHGYDLEAANAEYSSDSSEAADFVGDVDRYDVRLKRGEGKAQSIMSDVSTEIQPSEGMDLELLRATVGSDKYDQILSFLKIDGDELSRIMGDTSPKELVQVPSVDDGGGATGKGNRLIRSTRLANNINLVDGSQKHDPTVVSEQDIAEVLDATLIIAAASSLGVKQARQRGEKRELNMDNIVYQILAAVIKPAYIRRQWKAEWEVQSNPWFFGGWKWKLARAPPVPPRAAIALTALFAKQLGLTNSEIRSACVATLDGLTLANAMAEVELGATTYVCAPEALAPFDVAGALADVRAEAADPFVLEPAAGGLLGVSHQVRREVAVSLAIDRLHAYQARVPGAHPPRSLKWLCAFEQLRRIGITGSATGLPTCFGDAMKDLVELDVRGCRLGADPLLLHPFPDSMRKLGDTLRGFIAFHQSPRFCPPQEARWNPDGLSIDLTKDGRFAVAQPAEPSARGAGEDTSILAYSEHSRTPAHDDGVLPPSWSRGYNASSLECRPLFEMLSDYEGFDPGWQCIGTHASMNETVEGWAFLFNDTSAGGMPWWSWHRLEKFWIDGNFAYGTIPKNIGQLWPRMRTLDLYSNSLVGELPESIGDMKLLHQIQLQHNRLSGNVPPKLLHPDTLPLLLVLHLQLNTNLTGCVDPRAFAAAAPGSSGRKSMLAGHVQGSQVKLGNCKAK